MSKRLMVKAFNEWMRRYIEEPKRFKAEFESVRDYCHETRDGKVPSYGGRCTGYLCKLIEEFTV